MEGISFQFTVILLELTVGDITITVGTLGAMKENNASMASITIKPPDMRTSAFFTNKNLTI